MLSGYSTYLLNIRNNLIQCGVEVPVTPIQDYFDVCMLESELDDILWFYRVLAVSGSEYALSEFFLPLNGYFREKMRSIYYQEFLDFLQDYKTIGVEELRSKYINSGGDAYKSSIVEEVEKDVPLTEEESLSFDVEEDNDEEETEEINWDEDEEKVEELEWDDEEDEVEEEEEEDEQIDSPFGDNSYDHERYSPHGIYIEDLIENEDLSEDEEEESDEDGLGGFYEDEEEFLPEDDDQDGLGGYEEEESDEDGLGGYYDEDEEESDEDGLGGYEEYSDEDGLGGYEEDDDYSDEDGLGGYEEEEDYSDEDGLGGYEEEEEEYSDEDGLGGYYDEEDDQDGLGGYEDDEDDEDGLGGYYSEDEEGEEPLQAVIPDISQEQEEVSSPKPSTPPPRDLSDALQDFINGSLTSARNSIRGLKNRKK